MTVQRWLSTNLLHIQLGSILLGVYMWIVPGEIENLHIGLTQDFGLQDSLMIISLQF